MLGECSMAQQTITRNSVLNSRHKELGSTLDGETWNGMPIPWSYHTDANDEVATVRTRAGLYDVSGLNIVNVTGPDAQLILNQLVTIDVTRLEPGTSRLAAEVNEAGALVDDIMIICDSKDKYRLSHGGGATQQTLAVLAKGKAVTVEQDLDVHILSLQGPKSIDVLNPEVDFEVAELPYFKHVETILFGRNVVFGRGGYSGERGYEIYCKAKDAVYLWDMILEKGQPYGVIAASWDSLDLTRVEASLLFFPFDMPEGDTSPWEVNMGWCIDLDKEADYIGKAAVLERKGKERIKQAGMICMSAAAVEVGSKIYKGSIEVGVVTSSSYSQYLMQSLAMVHLKPEFTAIGTSLMIGGGVKAYVAKTPFYDPMRLRTHPV
jgi:aminomethyltransferase